MFRISKDRLEYIALIAEIVGGLGVIISVIYLALQVGDGNKELRAQNHHDALTLSQRAVEMLIQDEEVARLYTLGKKPDAELTNTETERLQYFYLLICNAWEFSYYQNEGDSIPPELWLGQDGWMRVEMATSPKLRQIWAGMQEDFAEPFRGYVNSLIREFNATGKIQDNKPPPNNTMESDP